MEKLPPELIQNIGAFLVPEAIDPFTSTSRHIRRILQPLIDQHQSLKRDFGHAICGRNESHGSIARLLLDVISKQHLHYYIRKLTIEDWHNEISPDNHGRVRLCTNSPNEMRQALHNDPTSLSSAISKLGTEEGVFPLLLWELSELRVLRVAGVPEDESMMLEALELIEENQSHPSAPLFPSFLPHLRVLQLHTNREGQEWVLGIGLAKIFATLIPSLRRLSVNHINDNCTDEFALQLLARPSNVEHLQFNSCVVGDKLIHRFLQGLPNLKTFTINEIPVHDWYKINRNHPDACTTRIDCYWLCVSLQMFCKDSLQSLTFDIPSYDSRKVANFLGDISMFKNLRYLELYPEGLIRSEDKSETVLPSSIEELRVKCGDDAESFATMCMDCTSLVEALKRRNSNLKHITVEGHMIREKTESSPSKTLESVHRFLKFGVQFEFLIWKFQVQVEVTKVQRVRQWEL